VDPIYVTYRGPKSRLHRLAGMLRGDGEADVKYDPGMENKDLYGDAVSTVQLAVQVLNTPGAVDYVRAKVGTFLAQYGNIAQVTIEGDDGGTDLAGQLTKLAQLHEAGQLTDEEFAQAKRKLLGD
jgi:hypothetical protein